MTRGSQLNAIDEIQLSVGLIKRWGRSLHRYSAPLIAAAAIIIVILRRPDQFLSPEVWVEEGTQLLPNYLKYGIAMIWTPVNGYLVLPSSLISFVSIHISFVQYPIVSYLVALCVTGAVALALFHARTMVPYPALVALIPFLIPTDAEVYGTGHYCFWLVSLLTPIVLLWRLEDSSVTLRAIYVLIGGLSAPLGIVLWPLFAMRALCRRKTSEMVVLLATTCAVAVQLYVYFSGQRGARAEFIENLKLLMIVEKFVGDFFINIQEWEFISLAVGCIALAAVAYAIFQEASRRNFAPAILALCFGAAVAASLLRVPIGLLDAQGSGPRYFFYPYVFAGWLLLTLATTYRARQIVFGCLLVAFFNAFDSFNRFHDDLDWQGTARACLAAESGSFDMPVHFAGDASIAWTLKLTAEECKRLER